MTIKFIGGPLDGRSMEVDPTFRTYRWEDGDYGSNLYRRLDDSEFLLAEDFWHTPERPTTLAKELTDREFVPL